jgi:GDP-mannose 4,6-dehydratase
MVRHCHRAGTLSILAFSILVIDQHRLAQATVFEKGAPCEGLSGKGRKAMVTGGTGMLGSHLSEALVDLGFEVYIFVRPRSKLGNIAKILTKVKLITGELTDPWRTLNAVQSVQPDRIFHFAAQAFNSMSFDDPDYTLDTNTKTTLNLLEAVRQAGLQNKTRLVLAGSSTVYGQSTEEIEGPISESAPMKPVSPYGVSKATTELLGQQYSRTHGIHVTIPRIFIHLATRGVESLALHEFSRQIAMIERGLQEPVIKHGEISTQRDITDIKDSAPVFICLPDVTPPGTVVNVGSGMTYTMRDLLELVVSKSTKSGIRLELDKARLRPYDEKIVVADISKLKKLTGWKPQPNMAGLAGELIEYWRQEINSRFPPNLQETKSEL